MHDKKSYINRIKCERIIIMWLIILLSGCFGKKDLTFHLLFKTSTPPVEINTSVIMKGLKIGYVKEITMKDMYFDVEVVIYSKFKNQMKKDCQFITKRSGPLGLWGEKYIEVIPSKSQNTPLIKNGEEIYIEE